MVTIYFYKTNQNGSDKLMERINVDTKEHAVQFLTKKKYNLKGFGGVYINRRNPKLYAMIG